MLFVRVYDSREEYALTLSTGWSQPRNWSAFDRLNEADHRQMLKDAATGGTIWIVLHEVKEVRPSLPSTLHTMV